MRFTPTVPHLMPESPWGAPLNVPVLSQPPQFSSPLYRLNVPTLLPAMQNGPRHRIAVKRSSAVEIKKPPEEPPAKSTTQSTQSTKSTSLSTTTAASSSTKETSGSGQLSSASSTMAAHKSAAPAAVKAPTPTPILTPGSGHHEQAVSTSLPSRAVDSDPHKQDHVVSAPISHSVDSQPVQQPWPNPSQVNNSASSIPSIVSSSSSFSSSSSSLRSHFVSSSYSSVATVPTVSKSVGLGRGRSLGKLSPPSPCSVGIGRGLAVLEGWHTIRNRRNPATVPQNFPPIGSGTGLDII